MAKRSSMTRSVGGLARNRLWVQKLAPALSTANVRALLTAALPLSELTVDEARRPFASDATMRSFRLQECGVVKAASPRGK